MFCTRHVVMLGLSGGEKVGLLIFGWCAVWWWWWGVRRGR